MVKFLNVILSLLFLCSSVVFADEVQPEQTANDNRATISIQKQPATEEAPQKQDVKRNWFCIIVQVNGKTPFDKTENK